MTHAQVEDRAPPGDPGLSVGAASLAVLQAQVAAPGEATLRDVAERVARVVADVEPAPDRAKWAERFGSLISSGVFLPSVPTLCNAGRSQRLAACFVLEVSDSLDSIYRTLHRAAMIQQGSGGIGIEFSALRPRGTPIEQAGGASPGPVAFAELFARSAHVMHMAGRRAGAHLAILRDDHPDIVRFVRARYDAPERFPQMGFAVAVSDRLLQAAKSDAIWALHHPHGRSSHVRAKRLVEEVIQSILATGGPTLLFVDRIDAANPTPRLGPLRATNPCGEQPLLPDESCVLGSLHLPRFLRADGTFDEALLRDVVWDAVRFLDDAVDACRWPDEAVAEASRRTRKLGLGVMGLADVLLLRELAYDQPEARGVAGQVLRSIAGAALEASCALASERGRFPAWESGAARRNATTLALAPTGTLRLIAGCSGGVEPFLAPRLAVRSSSRMLTFSDPWVEQWLDRFCDPEVVLRAIAADTPTVDLPGLSDTERRLLRRAWEISPAAQLEMQAEAQRYVDGAVSKTIHLDPTDPPDPERVFGWIQRARWLGCKGVAFYLRARQGAPYVIDL